MKSFRVRSTIVSQQSESTTEAIDNESRTRQSVLMTTIQRPQSPKFVDGNEDGMVWPGGLSCGCGIAALMDNCTIVSILCLIYDLMIDLCFGFANLACQAEIFIRSDEWISSKSSCWKV
jgi:hypothetical protein